MLLILESGLILRDLISSALTSFRVGTEHRFRATRLGAWDFLPKLAIGFVVVGKKFKQKG